MDDGEGVLDGWKGDLGFGVKWFLYYIERQQNLEPAVL